MKFIRKNLLRFSFFIFLFICILIVIYFIRQQNDRELFTGKEITPEIESYIQNLKQKDNHLFPFRYFTDNSDNILPIVAVTAAFRDDDAKERYYEYKENGIHIFGITAYKTFPNNKLFGEEEGEYERKDDFDYVGEIKDWLCCFKDKEKYGFTIFNNVIDISESDFYNVETDFNTIKKYDFIYICIKDGDECPLKGWNAINRNFDLALKCFPILCNEFHMKGLIVGRVGCGLENKYGNKLEVVEWLDWNILQQKMHESKMLFVPNVFDASPRVVTECITKNIPVLMNQKILCGSKYITYETGEFFSNEVDLKSALTNLQNRIYKISPAKWWSENYSQERSQKKLRNFLSEAFPGILDNVNEVKFLL